jgi:hypothetical protein
MPSQELFDFYLQQGYTPAQASGILGNIYAESAGDPQAFNPAGVGQGALGLFQWRGPRQDALRTFAESGGLDINDPLTQAQFSVSELQGTESKADRALRETTTVEDAARVFRELFERPGGHGFEAAQAGANRAFNEFGVGQTVGPQAASPGILSGILGPKRGQGILPGPKPTFADIFAQDAEGQSPIGDVGQSIAALGQAQPVQINPAPQGQAIQPVQRTNQSDLLSLFQAIGGR